MHTPGPWRLEYYDKNGQAVVKGEHIEICTCWHHSVSAIEKEMHHNARLIAAAPDLLEATALLLGFVKTLLDDPSRVADSLPCQKAEAAIAKAENQP